jgi:hypothetical protein
MLRAIRLFSPLILMKPQRVYWLGFVLLLASGGLAQSQQDARDVPNKFSGGGNILARRDADRLGPQQLC